MSEKMNVTVTSETLEKSMAKLTITVSADDFAKAVVKEYEKQRKQIAIPGFRKGRAPQKMIEKMYGEGIFFEGAINSLLPESYEVARESAGLDIVSRPQIDVVQVGKGQDLIYTATVATKPEVELCEYKGIELEKIDASVTDEEVDAEIKKVQEQNGREIVCERPIESGDTVVLDYAGSVDGVAFDGGTANGYSLKIGSNTFIPGFEDQLIGAKAGEDVDVNVTFPEDYHSDDLAGKAALFQCKIHEVKTKELPELDDEFAKDVSEFDTFDEYKADVKKNLEDKAAKQAVVKKQEMAVNKIVMESKMEIPDAMVATQAENMVEEYAQRMQMSGISMEQYYSLTGMNPQMMVDQMKVQALMNIKNRLVLEAIAAKENIEATEEETDAKIEEMAKAYDMELDKVKELMGQDGIDAVKSDIVAQKTLEFVADNAVEVEAKEEEAPAETPAE